MQRSTGQYLSLLALLLTASAAFGATQPNTTDVVVGLPELVPLQLLLGNAKYRNPQLTNDGEYLAYIKPDLKNKVNNIFVRRMPTAAQLASIPRNISLFEQQGTASDRQATFDTEDGVSAFSWAEDGSAIFYVQDKHGDENFHLYMVLTSSIFNTSSSSSSSSSSSGNSTAALEATDLTPFPGVKVQGLLSSERFPRRMYLGMNARDPRNFDLYELDLDSKSLRLYMINPGEVSNWLVDYDFNVRGIEAYNSTDGSTYVLINDALPFINITNTSHIPVTSPPPRSSLGSKNSNKQQQQQQDLKELFKQAAAKNYTIEQWIAASSSGSNVADWRRLITWPFGEEGSVFRFNRRGDALYGVSSTDRDTTEFQLISTAPGAKVIKRIASYPLANAGVATFDPVTWKPQLVSFSYLKPQWTILDPKIKADWQKIEAFRPRDVPNIISRSYDQKTWIISYGLDNATTALYLYRPGSWPPQLLFEMQPGLHAYKLAAMLPVVITARDGLKLPSYLTLPVKPNVPSVLPTCATGVVPDAKAHEKKASDSSPLKCPLNLKLPLVLYVHGGPWSRDTWGSDSVAQFLANRGYAVLQVNYRGSTGYGKRFANLGNRQWGTGSMQHDLTDAVKWAIEKGIADPAKVCIMGGSYGGYATLAGLAFTPQLYACGVDQVGVSNVASFLKSIPPYWQPLRIDFINRVGAVDTNSTLNQAISPLFHVNNIRAPLIIAQGANDPRVPQAESDQMFKAMKEKGLDVQYVLYPDEGHGLARPDNRLDFYSRVDQFLAKHLGGRSQPQLVQAGSSARVITQVQ